MQWYLIFTMIEKFKSAYRDTQVTKHARDATHPGFETQKSKTEVSVASQKGPIFLKIITKSPLPHDRYTLEQWYQWLHKKNQCLKKITKSLPFL